MAAKYIPHLLMAALLTLLLSAPSSIVHADRAFHTERVEFAAVGDNPLRSGFVVDIHANGPEIYAHERYVLNGATPDTEYQVVLLVYPFSESCVLEADSEPVSIPTTTLHTNSAGNGSADVFFHPDDVPPEWRNATHGIEWEIEDNGNVAYETSCLSVALD